MYPAKFDYVRAESVEQAVSLLDLHDDAKVLAGGHSLVPMLKLRLAQPATLVDIGRIEALRGIRRHDDVIRVGALTTHREIAGSEMLATDAPVLAQAAAQIGDPQVRNRGTLGGNIAHADPASDLPAVLVALGATIYVHGPQGERAVPASDFFVDLLATAIEENEVLTGVGFLALGENDGSAYTKCENPASGYAVVGAAAVARGDRLSLVFNGVTATPLVADQACASLGPDADADAIERALATLEVEDPLSDMHASADYRRHLARVYGRRALEAALGSRG